MDKELTDSDYRERPGPILLALMMVAAIAVIFFVYQHDFALSIVSCLAELILIAIYEKRQRFYIYMRMLEQEAEGKDARR
ncbi:MAG: hypothetical protein HZA25_02190 [Candidatus Niyogibacteria bacterium]|nr:hypothetical protein [Candidatus Niyogibacteria bacterium]